MSQSPCKSALVENDSIIILDEILKIGLLMKTSYNFIPSIGRLKVRSLNPNPSNLPGDLTLNWL